MSMMLQTLRKENNENQFQVIKKKKDSILDFLFQIVFA